MLHAVPIFRSDGGGFSVGSPTAPDVDREGVQRRDADGKRLFRPLLTFETRADRDRFNGMVLRALAEAGVGSAQPQPHVPRLGHANDGGRP